MDRSCGPPIDPSHAFRHYAILIFPSRQDMRSGQSKKRTEVLSNPRPRFGTSLAAAFFYYCVHCPS
jgi:hypothetical protein